MAEVNKRNSTSGSVKTRGRSQKTTKLKKTEAKPSVNEDSDSQVTCDKCLNVFVDDNDKLMECERCSSWFCAECLGFTDMEYEVMGKRKDFHWFCEGCEKPAIVAVLSDKQIEEKCAAYMKSMTGRIDELEGKLDNKANRGCVVDLEKRVKDLESLRAGTGAGAPAALIDVSEQQISDSVKETIQEQRERDHRKMSIIIQNLAESKEIEFEERQAEDTELVNNILNVIGVDEVDAVKSCERIGKKDPKKIRLTKVTVSSEEVKRKILKGSRALKDNEGYKEVYIGPDLTKMQRLEEYKLRKELRDRRDQGETDIFIRGGRIVQRQQRASQFRGGAAVTGAAAPGTDSEGAE